jgi:hypothetical protein
MASQTKALRLPSMRRSTKQVVGSATPNLTLSIEGTSKKEPERAGPWKCRRQALTRTTVMRRCPIPVVYEYTIDRRRGLLGPTSWLDFRYQLSEKIEPTIWFSSPKYHPLQHIESTA